MKKRHAKIGQPYGTVPKNAPAHNMKGNIKAYAALSLPRVGSIWKNRQTKELEVVLPYVDSGHVRFLCQDSSENTILLYNVYEHYNFVKRGEENAKETE